MNTSPESTSLTLIEHFNKLPWEDIQQYCFLNEGQLVLDQSQALAILDDKIVSILKSFNIPRMTQLIDDYRAYTSERKRILEEQERALSYIEKRSNYTPNEAELAVYREFSPQLDSISKKISGCAKYLGPEIEKACAWSKYGENEKKCDMLSAFLNLPLRGGNPLSLADITNWENGFSYLENTVYLVFDETNQIRPITHGFMQDPQYINDALHLSVLEKMQKNCISRAKQYDYDPSKLSYCLSEVSAVTEKIQIIGLTDYAANVLQKSNLPNQAEISRLLSIGVKNTESFQKITSVNISDQVRAAISSQLNPAPSPVENSTGIFSQIYNTFSSIAHSSTALTIGLAGMGPQLNLAWKAMIEGLSALPFNTASTASDRNNTTANNNIAVLTALAAMAATIVAFKTLQAKKKKQPRENNPSIRDADPSLVALFSEQRPSSQAHVTPPAAEENDGKRNDRKRRGLK